MTNAPNRTSFNSDNMMFNVLFSSERSRKANEPRICKRTYKTNAINSTTTSIRIEHLYSGPRKKSKFIEFECQHLLE